MKKLVFVILVVMGFAGMAMLNSCNKGETYAEMKKKEKKNFTYFFTSIFLLTFQNNSPNVLMLFFDYAGAFLWLY